MEIFVEAVLTDAEVESVSGILDDLEDNGLTVDPKDPPFNVTSSNDEAASCYESYFQNGETSRPRDLVPLTPPRAVLCCVVLCCVVRACVPTLTVSVYCASFAKIGQSYFQNGETSRPQDLVPLTPPRAVLCCVVRACVPTIQFSSVQFKMVPIRSGRPICAPPRLSEVSPMLPLKQFQCWSD